MYNRFFFLCLIALVCLFSTARLEAFTSTDKVRIGNDYQKLINYPYLNRQDSLDFARQRLQQLEVRKALNIPAHFTIPMEMVAFRREGRNTYVEKYNTERSIGVGYIPSDLVSHYEQESWKAYQKYGKDAPTLSIVLAQQFTESHFDPNVKGDRGQSIGLPQLYHQTAKWLYQTDSSFWKQYFYFDQNENHHFHGVHSMIVFPFIFLHKYKRYRADQKFEGLRRYNGAGKQAERYAALIMQRSLFYENWMAYYREIDLQENHLYRLLTDFINMQLFNKSLKPIEESTLDELFALSSLDYKGDEENISIAKSLYENKVTVERNLDYQVGSANKEHYIRIEEGRTLYSYFKDVETLIKVINHPKNESFFCYHKSNGKVLKITNYQDVKNGDFYTNAKVGDYIFLPTGTTLVAPQTNIMIMTGHI